MRENERDGKMARYAWFVAKIFADGEITQFSLRNVVRKSGVLINIVKVIYRRAV